MKRLLLLAVLIAIPGCALMPQPPKTTLEQIEQAEISAQEVSASIVNLTCSKFVAKQCAEPGKAFLPDEGAKYHDQVQRVRGALRVASTLSAGSVGQCLGETRSQVGCLAAARVLLGQIEMKVNRREKP